MLYTKYFYLFLNFIYSVCNVAPRTRTRNPSPGRTGNESFPEGREINRNRTNGLILYSFFLILGMGRFREKPERLLKQTLWRWLE